MSVLRIFLEHSDRPSGTLRYHELQGFVFALASAPELVPPSEWMPMILGEREAGYQTLAEAQAVLSELMGLYNSVNAAVAADRATLPVDCTFRKRPLANLDDGAPIAEWSRGFMRGHQWLEESWNAYLPADLDDDLGAILMTLSFFSSVNLAEAFCLEAGQKDVAAMATLICRVFPDAVAEYAGLGRTIQKVLLESQAADARPRQSAKIGRNEPCPCGSGRKYKMCCGSGRAG
jgi:uncharacterized protein